MPKLLIFGLGYVGRAVARAAIRAGFSVVATVRAAADMTGEPPDMALIAPERAPAVIPAVTHLLVTAAPDGSGDPLLALPGAAAAIAASPIAWIGYLSTTGVYGDRAGGWVNESTPPEPASARSRRRLAAEQGWRAFAAGRAVDLFRLGGIYGPGRSALEEVRAGRARRIVRPGHCFSRIHRADIVRAVLAAMTQAPRACVRVLNLVDDEPAEPARVTEEAARLLGLAPPPELPFEAAFAAMSPMARSFWAENRKVANAATKAALGLGWRYPTYREGLRAILQEGRQGGL
ncbi:MAG TPA: SDR family NAD(P)-dependent oxidoreductase [Acetobacteraceae bacterium]|nr:SDR family NAD(P)-dependent oxidoreductase [Acetobacteraceae bacterium]